MRSSRLRVLLVLLVACASGHTLGAPDGSPKWVVAWRGAERPKARAGRVEPSIRDASVNHAAEELARHMGDVLGTDVEIAPWAKAAGENLFLVTEEQYAPEDVRRALAGKRLDAFVIKYPAVVDGRKVCLLASRDSMGYLFAVYYFLREYLGVEWVGPGEVGRIVPNRPDWSMPEQIDVLENPDYEHRAWSSPAVDARCWLANGRRLAFHHGMHHAFDPRRYADQPDLYPFYEGRRHVPDGSIRRERISRWQPCTSHPKAVDLAAQYGLEHLARRPGILSFSLSVNDGGVGYCMCDGCLAQDSKDAWNHGNPWLTDRFYRFYNQVIERVLQENPDAYLAVLGYNRVKSPPTEVKIHPRIIVFNCVDNTSPITDMARRQKAWKAAGAIPALYFRVPDMGFLTVRHYPHALADMIRLTHDMGGFGLYTETITNWAAGGPRMYVLAHVLWDTQADVDELLDRYMRRAFGPAAGPHVRDYFDRWEQVWERGDPLLRYNTTRSNKDAGQLDELERADLAAMDAALAEAQAVPATPAEKKRLEYIAAYYRWLRPNADQYLLAREFRDPDWVDRRSPEEVFREAERGLALTDQFTQTWRDVISQDRTGWLVSVRIEAGEEVAWKSFVAPVRDGVLAAYESGLDEAFNRLTERMLRKQSKSEVEQFWKDHLGRHPKLARWSKTQAHLLEKGPGENLLVNGDFERGGQGDPPTIDGWTLRGAWQGVPTEFAWEPESGCAGSRALAVGKGRIGQLGTSAPTTPGHRYRLDFWYKTHADLNETARVFLHGLPAGRLPLAPTGGQWRRWSTTFTSSKTRTTIMLEVKGVDKGESVWFDDARLVEIGSK